MLLCLLHTHFKLKGEKKKYHTPSNERIVYYVIQCEQMRFARVIFVINTCALEKTVAISELFLVFNLLVSDPVHMFASLNFILVILLF